MTQQTLAEMGLPLNCNPPRGEPGGRYILIGTGDFHSPEEAVAIALQHRKTHPSEPVAIWPVSGDTWRVVRDTGVKG